MLLPRLIETKRTAFPRIFEVAARSHAHKASLVSGVQRMSVRCTLSIIERGRDIKCKMRVKYYSNTTICPSDQGRQRHAPNTIPGQEPVTAHSESRETELREADRSVCESGA